MIILKHPYPVLLVCNAVFIAVFLFAGIVSRQIVSGRIDYEAAEEITDAEIRGYQSDENRDKLEILIMSHRELYRVVSMSLRLLSKISLVLCLYFSFNTILAWQLRGGRGHVSKRAG